MLPTRVHVVKVVVFPVVMYGCESWTIKKAECQRIDFLTVVLEKTLESPLDCKEIQPVHPKGNQCPYTSACARAHVHFVVWGVQARGCQS